MADDDTHKTLRESAGNGSWFRRPSVTRRQVFRLGETVRIKSGPFASFTGIVVGINQAKSLLKVMVTIFGQEKPLKLSFSEVEKVFGT